ncbi:ATP-dependent DNA helicase [Aspergillus mulundensis]|uniref:ATP-dependent DNA helicase n=1 Tax=Aspergillus mulundensis TaxID=1810919 RepID=A0A3D8QVX6_9EURO|nr:ATP-dependent DNA helicase [Aspergillus mulundensis]RDW65820.1 ATP-dependent DNA helicase [Aspergillus mulundensis]
MASFTGQTIEELEEELDLQKAILQSLHETFSSRSDALEQKQETLEVIRDLERSLARLRGSNTDRSFSIGQSLAPSQLDGSTFSTPSVTFSPPQAGRASFSLPSRPRDSRPDLPSGMFSTRKRPFADDDEDDESHFSFKRATGSRASPAFDQAASSISFNRSSPDYLANTEYDEDDILGIFGVEGEDMRTIQEEHRRAEKWLEERKKQERRDAEFARNLMSHGMQSSTAFTPLNSSSASRPESSFPGREHLSPQTAQPGSANPLFSSTIPGGLMAPPLNGNNAFRGPQFESSRSLTDSDDSDLAEITPLDFQSRTVFNPRNISHLPPYPSNHGDTGSGVSNVSRPLHGPHSNPYASPGAVPGPSGAVNTSSMWPQLASSAAAAYRGARDFLNERAGGSSLLSSAMSSLGDVITNGFVDDEYRSDYYGRDSIRDFYENGADPKQVNEEIKQLLETIRPDADISAKDREGTPEALRFTLYDHQKLGLAWMKSKEECDQNGGILADDMGLGKTIQAIALMVSRPSSDPERKTTLIIAPVALMQQWKREIEKIIRPKHRLQVYILHGAQSKTNFSELKKFDVVLTTFGTLASELKRVNEYEKLLKEGAEESTLSRQFLRKLPCLGPISKWYRVIIDEAQCIKNRGTQSAMACCRLNATYRWCMSGTPMMNTVEELHSLLKFLRNRPYASLEKFRQDFSQPLKSGFKGSQDKAMQQFRVLIKAVLLRRTKDSKIDGKPILNLPRRVSEKVHAAFSEDELELYKALEAKTQLQFNKYLAAGSVGRNYSNILVLLLRLRQACCHPHLITDFSVKLNETTQEVDLMANAREFSDEVIARLRDNPNLECPVCIDAVDNPIIFFPCGHGTCSECFSRISDPSLALQNGVDGQAQVKCPNCRGLVDPKKITDHVSFRKVHFADGSEDVGGLDGLGVAADEDEDDDDTDDSDEGGTLSDFIVNDSDDDSTPPRKAKAKSKGKGKGNPKKSLAQLKKEASKNQASKRKYMRRLEKTWITSAKIEKTMEIIRDVEHQANDEKIIIFSQFTSLLDLLEVPIAREGHRYRRYDGSMKPSDRNSAVLAFTDDPTCKIMLVSLKAGNAGLNLVAANHVVIFDPFWNPYVEEQAIDRAHRIGQMREVQVHRILVPETVEDRIVELQDKKRAIIDGALDEKESKNIARLSVRELGYLFGIAQ